MTALLSKPSQHAIRALVYLSRLGPADSATVQTIASATDIPQAFLAKVVRRLVEAELLESFRGPGGGVRLARPPHLITVLEVLEMLDTESAVVGSCVLGLEECGGDRPCPMHATWTEIRRQLRRGLSGATISSLSIAMD